MAMRQNSQSLEDDGLPVTAALLSSDMKMAARRGTVENGHRKLNGVDDIPRPFLIGVAGGTASGKVGWTFFHIFPLFGSLIWAKILRTSQYTFLLQCTNHVLARLRRKSLPNFTISSKSHQN